MRATSSRTTGGRQLAEFLRLKRKHAPEERFQSEWYRHDRAMFGVNRALADAARGR